MTVEQDPVEARLQRIAEQGDIPAARALSRQIQDATRAAIKMHVDQLLSCMGSVRPAKRFIDQMVATMAEANPGGVLRLTRKSLGWQFDGIYNLMLPRNGSKTSQLTLLIRRKIERLNEKILNDTLELWFVENDSVKEFLAGEKGE